VSAAREFERAPKGKGVTTTVGQPEKPLNSSLAAPLQGPVSLNLPFSSESAGEVRRALASWLTHLGSNESVINDARLVVTELVGNAVRHASPLANGTVLVRWHHDADQLVLSVCDGGGDSSPVAEETELDSERGRGLVIVQALALRWCVEHNHRVHAVHVRMPLL
jgi:anti-sigma regulatory factor (Ser/Thr protein kinase)